MSIDGSVVSFTIPAVDLPGNLELDTRYYFIVGSDVIDNGGGDPWTGLEIDDWAFQTVA